jgi:hypothetical protein
MHRFCSEDVDRAQVPAKDLILGKLSKQKCVEINFLNNFAAKTTRIVPAPFMTVVSERPIPRAR